jgi:hypothetical protein
MMSISAASNLYNGSMESVKGKENEKCYSSFVPEAVILASKDASYRKGY